MNGSHEGGSKIIPCNLNRFRPVVCGDLYLCINGGKGGEKGGGRPESELACPQKRNTSRITLRSDRNRVSLRRDASHPLPPFDPKSEELSELFPSFLLSKDECMTTLTFSEEDAKLFIEIISRVCSSQTSFGAPYPMIFSLNTKAFRTARLGIKLGKVAFGVPRKSRRRM